MKKKVSPMKARPRPKSKASAGPKFKKTNPAADVVTKVTKKVKQVSRSIADALVPPESSDD